MKVGWKTIMKQQKLVEKMTIEEKAAILSGKTVWQTREIDRLSIPSIFLSDGHKMPFMDGLELSEQVKKVLPATKIMILSGYNEFDYAKMAIKIGVTDYLLKPISSEKLLDAVNKVAEEIRKEQSEKEQMNQYAREMQENKESEKFQFFNQVFAGSMPFGECLEQGKQLGIEISAEGYCVILFKIIMIDHPMDYNEDIVSATEDIENLS